MASNPFRPCDYCGSNRNSPIHEPRFERRAWTLFHTTRKVACPSCWWKGHQEDAQLQVLIAKHHRLLRNRLAAEPDAAYGDPLRAQWERVEHGKTKALVDELQHELAMLTEKLQAKESVGLKKANAAERAELLRDPVLRSLRERNERLSRMVSNLRGTNKKLISDLLALERRAGLNGEAPDAAVPDASRLAGRDEEHRRSSGVTDAEGVGEMPE